MNATLKTPGKNITGPLSDKFSTKKYLVEHNLHPDNFIDFQEWFTAYKAHITARINNNLKEEWEKVKGDCGLSKASLLINEKHKVGLVLEVSPIYSIYQEISSAKISTTSGIGIINYHYRIGF